MGPGSSAPRGHHTTLILSVLSLPQQKWGHVGGRPQAVEAARTPQPGSPRSCVTHIRSMRTQRAHETLRKTPRKPSQQNQGPYTNLKLLKSGSDGQKSGQRLGLSSPRPEGTGEAPRAAETRPGRGQASLAQQATLPGGPLAGGEQGGSSRELAMLITHQQPD